jgi:serine/threonine protein kinase
MSPELLGAKALHQAQALYDGTKADIWAAGVMLCVMLIGRFPFEGIEMSSATNLEEVSEHVSCMGRPCSASTHARWGWRTRCRGTGVEDTVAQLLRVC